MGLGRHVTAVPRLNEVSKLPPPPNVTTCPFVDFVVLPPGHGRSVTDF